MRESVVFKALHRTQLVGGMNKQWAGLIWSLAFAAAMLMFMTGMEVWAWAPILSGYLVFRWMKYRYAREPAIDKILKSYEIQGDTYDPWPQKAPLRGDYIRPEGFAKNVRS
jgi:hypothetical protein